MRRVAHAQIRHGCPFHPVECKQHRSFQGFVYPAFLPERLAVPVDHRLFISKVAVDIHILASELPEDRLVLVVVFEALLSPVVHVVGKVDLAGNYEVNVLEEGEVKSRVNLVRLVEYNGASVVTLLNRAEYPGRVIPLGAAARLDVTITTRISRW